MIFKTSSRILVIALLFGAVAWVLDAWLSSVLFPDATFWELLTGDFPDRSIYVRSVVVVLIVIFGLVAGSLMSRLEADWEARHRGELETHQEREQLLKHQNMEAIGSLAGGFAHEFNNILQAMMGSAYIADLQSGGEGSPIHEHLRDIQMSGARAAKLCDQMLTFAGKKSVLLKDIYVDKQLNAIEGLLRKTTGELPLTFSLRAPDIIMGGDAGLFRDLFENVLKNSVEARGEHAITVEIATRYRTCVEEDIADFMSGSLLTPGEYVEIVVKDTGTGIAANVKDRIFDPFYSTKFQGRGLGLSEVMGIVRTFSGGVKVTSALNLGTTFTFLFPARLAEERSSKRSSSLPNPTGHGLIWIVDDELLITQTLQRVLTRWGFNVHTARSGEEFLDLFPATAEDCSCILLDLTMPGIGGEEVHASLRNTYANIPVIVMSGYSEEQSLSKFESNDIAGFLHKPFPLESMEEVLRKVLPQDCWSK
ncbi:MAG: response regulator [Verrucomicrobia bacterium]|nr:response regulator [Verrucomicrobiota bacterium]MCH8526106.1 response regulator [Kiritimatiellia bacterium]